MYLINIWYNGGDVQFLSTNSNSLKRWKKYSHLINPMYSSFSLVAQTWQNRNVVEFSDGSHDVQKYCRHDTSLSLGPAFVFIKGIPLKAFLVAASTIALKECLCIFVCANLKFCLTHFSSLTYKVWLDWKKYNVNALNICSSLIIGERRFSNVNVYQINWGVYIMYKYHSSYDQWQDTGVWSRCLRR